MTIPRGEINGNIFQGEALNNPAEPMNTVEAGADIKILLSRLDFPKREEVAEMDFKKLHELWSKNHNQILQVLQSLNLEKFPHLATHGTHAAGLEYAQRNNIPISLLLNYKKPSTAEEAATILYALTSSGINHSYPDSPKNRGGFIVINLGLEDPTTRVNLGKKIKLRMSYLNPIPNYPVPQDESQPLSAENYRWAEADFPNESQCFKEIRTMEDEGDLAAAEMQSENLKKTELKNFSIKMENLPQYHEVRGKNEVIDGYIRQVILRLESQAAIAEILKNSGPN